MDSLFFTSSRVERRASWIGSGSSSVLLRRGETVSIGRSTLAWFFARVGVFAVPDPLYVGCDGGFDLGSGYRSGLSMVLVMVVVDWILFEFC